MRNCSEWIIAFWACQLLGAVSSHINAWLPSKPFVHCLTHISAKVIIVDPERAKVLSPHLGSLGSGRHVLVARADGGVSLAKPLRIPSGMDSMDREMEADKGSVDAWRKEPEAQADDNATIFFTSGTTGLPKGVVSTQRSFMHGFMVRHFNWSDDTFAKRVAGLIILSRTHAFAPWPRALGSWRPK